MADGICPLCSKPSKVRGWCWGHYERWRKYGDPLGGRPRFETIEDRFWAKVAKTDGCWLWTGAIKENGYGVFGVANRNAHAHRWAYENTVGPIPTGLDLDHLCRVRHCVNPAHLEPVTRKVNLNRGRNYYRERTHCIRGHEFTPENTRRVGRHRWCRACDRERGRQKRLKAG